MPRYTEARGDGLVSLCDDLCRFYQRRMAVSESFLAKTVAGQLGRADSLARSQMTSAFGGISDLAGRASASTRSQMTSGPMQRNHLVGPGGD